MAIRYEITGGVLPITVYLMQGLTEIDNNVHVIYEQGEFVDVPVGEYYLRFVDSLPCESEYNLNLFTSTTTTTDEPTTTTTTTAEISICNNYGVGASTGTLTEGGESIGLFVDEDAILVNLPFDFRFFNVLYSSIYVASNGHISFSDNYTTYNTSNLPDSALNNVICALWYDLSSEEAGDIKSITTGSAPNRCFIIRYDIPTYDGSPTISEHFEIRLYETTNNIELVYGNTTISGSAIIGIQKDHGECYYYQYEDTPVASGTLIQYQYCNGIEVYCTTTTSTTICYNPGYGVSFTKCDNTGGGGGTIGNAEHLTVGKWYLVYFAAIGYVRLLVEEFLGCGYDTSGHDLIHDADKKDTEGEVICP